MAHIKERAERFELGILAALLSLTAIARGAIAMLGAAPWPRPLRTLAADQRGAGLVEYSIIVGAIAIGGIAAATAVRGAITTELTAVSSQIATIVT